MSTTIWMYHRVLAPCATAFGLPGCYHLRGTAITPEAWAEDLERLRPVVSLAAVVGALAAGRVPPAGHVLTFDDGYREWVELVVPSLRAASATATFFVTTAMHRGGRVHAIDAYYWLLDHAAVAVWEVELPDDSRARGDLRTIEGKVELVVGSPIKKLLVGGDAETQAAVLAAVARAVGCEVPPGLGASMYMDEAQWRALARADTVGAHGVTHRPWTRLEDSALARELVAGRNVLRAATGTAIEFAAYPDGAWDERVVAATREAGYRAAVTVDEGRVWDGLFTLSRVFRRGAAALMHR